MINVKSVYRSSFWILLLMFLACLPHQLIAKILVVVPHPDDDVLLAAGIIAHATARGEPVKVVYLTNGDFNGLEQGYIRQNEAVQAETLYLGMKEDNLIFLGYPDGRLTKLLRDYANPGDKYTTLFDQAHTYGRRGLGFADYHSYRFGLPANYNSYNIIRDLYDIIYRFRPDHIFTTSKYDYHPDHSATYSYVRLALAILEKTEVALRPTLHSGIIHFGAIGSERWPEPANPSKYFSEPYNFSDAGLDWNSRESIDVPLAMQSTDLRSNLKYLALLEHQSQFYLSSFLSQFLHKDEIFWVEAGKETDYPPLVQAGRDIFLREGASCKLDASGSRAADGRPLTYTWKQTNGRTARLINPNTSTPALSLPLLNADPDAQPEHGKEIETLTFELVVSNGDYTSIPDSMSVYVIPYNDESGPKIDISYRTVQIFSHIKLFESWAHIKGRVRDPEGIAALSYALNNHAEHSIPARLRPLTSMANAQKISNYTSEAPQRANSRQRQTGDHLEFNLKLPLSSLQENLNHIIVTATDKDGHRSYEVITVNFRAENLWPLMLMALIAFLICRKA